MRYRLLAKAKLKKLSGLLNDDSLGIFFVLIVIFPLVYFLLLASTITKIQSVETNEIIELPIKHVFNNPKNPQIPILIYHYVEYVQDPNDHIRVSLDILPQVFEGQVITLKNDGYTFLTPRLIQPILDGKVKLPKKPVILSFDDGYEDFYTDVFPVLKRHNIHAVAYIISGFLDQPNYMSKQELKEVAESGLVEIACHTINHPNMSEMTPEQAEPEVRGCKETLEKEYKIKVVSFAYPYGGYNSQLFDVLKQAGFTNAVTTEPGMDVLSNATYAIPRMRAGNRIGQELTSYLQTTSTISINSALPNQKD